MLARAETSVRELRSSAPATPELEAAAQRANAAMAAARQAIDERKKVLGLMA